MTYNQEEALYDFLDNVAEPFDLEMVMTFLRMIDATRIYHLADEVNDFINERKLAFLVGNRQWISRRGFFETAPFVISPTRLELLNGILIPGHRCVPFANPGMLPQEYIFHWKGTQIPFTTTEGEPEEFYPYYTIFGEEYAPQYVARDNPENEEAFSSDPYEDPPEVSICTLDMRNIYREASFVPGDRFVAKLIDWNKGIFNLEKVDAKTWSTADLYAWFEAAEGGFEDSFANLGPGATTEEQIAYAYWYGGKRMRQVPSYSLEEFLYEKTERIETTAYGIETRFWYTGREIPDLKCLDRSQVRPDRSKIEDFLNEKRIPLSELALRCYLLDYLHRREKETTALIDRIFPPAVAISGEDRKEFEKYINQEIAALHGFYSPFTGKNIGPVRQRVCELHTAVIELACGLENENVDSKGLPKQAFIILSQIQNHAAGVMEDLDIEEVPLPEELEAIDNSLDSMIETYDDIKKSIEEALENFRKNRFFIVRSHSKEAQWLVQLSIGGTDIWRRIVIPADYSLGELHSIIQNIFGWKNSWIFQFSEEKIMDATLTIGKLANSGFSEFLYEYGTKWTVKVMILTRNERQGAGSVRCVAGEGAAPPESIGGPLRFRRFVMALSGINETERQDAGEELGRNFNPNFFDLESCNRNLESASAVIGRENDEG